MKPLHAAYERLAPGTLPEDLSTESLGPWEDTSFHLRGDLDFAGGEASFGVALRNGLARPWASGHRSVGEAREQFRPVRNRELERRFAGHDYHRRKPSPETHA